MRLERLAQNAPVESVEVIAESVTTNVNGDPAEVNFISYMLCFMFYVSD